ncbi:magnesium transporter CorA family protein [Sinorhizobium meliloti]|uniref:magnesium transporter CorA family protein n=1 Tax=Rhizobium meliloti TaxID=382 RepID=UPI0001E4C7DA|nr:magnesium transporter CorA family protein [Sinorhizobium meliloti]AEG06318.1 Mg2 transporter protein CorA family protein [Sinorhizobium meliloti BL225C]ASP71686.1 magnesium transporter [Sinorhizobium meliloti]MDE3827710.1 magnesium transporter CorA family protein [Sinorhizobium meliloti]MDE3856205.1 magnesium transporter CorA family protein [Sinorhizobium meliloti]MDE4543850.1 magnesium transporter CorA family protein [Sinorhizobium meliloti]
MLRIYKSQNSRLVLVDLLDGLACQEPVIWFDLFNPSSEETRLVEERLGIAIPTRDEMQEIELSDRLYQEDGAEFMTMTATAKLDSDYPAKVPVTFILKGATLVTVRHAEPKPFQVYANRIMKPNGAACETGELVMLGLLEAMIDRTADALERAGNDVDQISREVFRKSNASATKKTRDLQSLIEQIGQKGDLLTVIRESLVSIGRLVAYHVAIEGSTPRKAAKESRQRIKLVQRDAASLGDHALFLSNKINFLLDATLGLINLEQNQIIKIFSVAAVVFLPPTLVASIYGMNFEVMPEVTWRFGYPYALILMIASALLPYVYFKRRGWL